MPAYRPDIDGLRAIAVVSVILYHLNNSWLPGGFAGVDVFFVISGYLITSMLLDARGTFRQSLAGFYLRRIRRILPALFVLLAATAIAAWLWLSPAELTEVSSNILAATLFVSNVLLARSHDYFQPASQWQPLLHLWSLAIEEQFYIVFPAILFVLPRRGLHWALGALCLASLALYIGLSGSHPVWAFYFPMTRAWELLAGAFVLAAARQSQGPAGGAAQAFSALGLLAIIAPMFLEQHAGDVAYRTVLASAGTAAFIWANARSQTVAGLVTGSAPMRAIGLISYSLYLYHWPIIVFYRRLALRELVLTDVLAILVLTFAAAWLSWRFVERPFRRKQMPDGRVLAAAAAAAVLLCAAAAAAVVAHGVPARLAGEQRRLLAFDDYRSTAEYRRMAAAAGCWIDRTDFDANRCLHFSGTKPNILIWGDSYAGRYFAGLAEIGARHGINVLLASHSSCWPQGGGDAAQDADCAAFNTGIARALQAHRGTLVVLAARFSARLPADAGLVARAARVMAAQGHRVVILSATPEFAYRVPWLLARQAATGDARYGSYNGNRRRVDDTADGLLKSALAGQPQVALVTGGTICGKSCPLILPDGTPLAFDEGHFTLAGSRFAAARAWPTIAAALAR